MWWDRSAFSAELLQATGIKLYARRTGRIEDVLTSLFRVNEHF